MVKIWSDFPGDFRSFQCQAQRTSEAWIVKSNRASTQLYLIFWLDDKWASALVPYFWKTAVQLTAERIREWTPKARENLNLQNRTRQKYKFAQIFRQMKSFVLTDFLMNFLLWSNYVLCIFLRLSLLSLLCFLWCSSQCLQSLLTG